MKKVDKNSNTDRDQYIPIDGCKDRHLYIINARNADIGVYIAEEEAFKISRYKFTSNFIDKEYHWDIKPIPLLPPPFPELQGTVKPLKKLEYFGDGEDEVILERLNKRMKELWYELKRMKKQVTVPIEIISTERMKKLRMFH